MTTCRFFLQVRVHVHRGHVPRVGEATLFDAGEDGLHRLDGPLDATALPADDAASICVAIVGPVVDLGLPAPRLLLRWMRSVADDPAVLVVLLCRSLKGGDELLGTGVVLVNALLSHQVLGDPRDLLLRSEAQGVRELSAYRNARHS